MKDQVILYLITSLIPTLMIGLVLHGLFEEFQVTFVCRVDKWTITKHSQS